MGERSKDAYRLNFDRKLKVEFHGTKVTSDAGLLAYRELDEVLGLTTRIESELTDSRTGKNAQHGLLYKSARKLPQKREFLIVQREIGKIIDVIRRKLCCLTVYLGNVGLLLFSCFS